MNENERYERLNDYLDGVLSGEELRAFEAELERDPALRDEEQSLRALLSEAARLPKGIAPQHDLWAGIDSRLTERTPSRRTVRRMYATVYRGLIAVAAAVLIFVAGVWYAQRNQPAPVDTTAKAPVQEQPAPQVEFASYQQIEEQYAGVRASLREALDQARPNLAPETVKVVDDSLVTIDNAIHEIESALAKDPGNHGLIRSLVAVYDQEVDLLQQMSDIAAGPGETSA